MLAGESNKLVTLATLWHLNAVAVEPFLDLAVAPALEKLVAQRLLSSGGGLGSRGVFLSSAVGSESRVAAERCNKLVASAWLWDWNATLIEPGLEVIVRPRLVEPVARVSSSLACLVSSLLVVGAGSVEK